jgi:ribosomal protein uL23
VNPHDVILYPLMTERSVYMIENENKLVFIVNFKANKHDVSRAVHDLYGVDVANVNTLISRKNTKKAFVKLTDEHDASDLAIRLGIL